MPDTEMEQVTDQDTTANVTDPHLAQLIDRIERMEEEIRQMREEGE